ncbi:MAG: UpxY family transcription antiterminator [Ginsengibacter sp.]
MQSNWYAVYTKPNCEKKVASLFTRRKIENFCPVNCRKINSFRRTKILLGPLFKSYVFVNIAPAEIESLRQTDGIISILYWMGEPAIIKQDEIDAIKEFTGDYQNIELERTQVNMHDIARVVDGPSYSMEGNVFAVKNKTLKVSLPSLGYIMIAKMEDESIFQRETSYKTIRMSIENETQQ